MPQLRDFIRNNEDLHKAILLFFPLAFAALNFVLRTPGEWNADSIIQYQQASSGNFTDWHPPIMAALWSVLPRIGGDGASMFFLQIITYWGGFGIIADALRRNHELLKAYFVLVVGLTPLFLMLTVCLHKDVGMADAYLFSFAIIFWFKSQEKKIPIWSLLLAFIFLFYGLLVRVNGVFAGVPIVLWICHSRFSPVWRYALFFAVLTVIMLAGGDFINHKIILAKKTYPIHSLQSFDLAGIADLSNDRQFLPSDTSLEEIHRCYSPIMWDTLHMKGCRVVAQEKVEKASYELTSLWLKAIEQHPFFYLEHRVLSFNSFLYFYVPHHHTEAVRPIGSKSIEGNGLKARVMDWLRFGIFFTPVFFTIFSGCTLFLGSGKGDWLEVASKTLFTSGLAYLLGFLVIGVATDIRYELWSMMAFALCSILMFARFYDKLKSSQLSFGLCLFALSFVFAIMAYPRETKDISLLNQAYVGYHEAAP